MKSIQIKRVLLAAAMLAGVACAQDYEETPLHVVYCKATILQGTDGGYTNISVTLPPTEGYYDRNGIPITYWNVGEVPTGGVVDSWHQEGGPGRFTAKNDGNCGAYLYVKSSEGHREYCSESSGYCVKPWFSDNEWSSYGAVDPGIFGGGNISVMPCSSLQQWRGDDSAYHLAFTTDVTAKIPTWHSLEYCIDCAYDHHRGGWHRCEDGYNEVAAYMGYVEPGEYLSFDMKLWAPRGSHNIGSMLFTFCVEASEFPLWDHGRAVE